MMRSVFSYVAAVVLFLTLSGCSKERQVFCDLTLRLVQPDGLQAVTVYGSEDRVLNRKKLEQGRPFLPEKAVWLEIPGGNHAQFGDYGAQKGDGTASISAQEQLRQTEDVILNMMNDPSGT